MTLLPKLLYLFQTLPIPVPYTHLRKLQADLIRFAWNYKRHRIPRSVLMASRSHGGLAFSNFLKYYQATQLRTLTSWFPQRSYNKWTEIEKIWLAPLHLNSLLWNVNVEVDPVRLLGSMSQLKLLWHKLSCEQELKSEKSLLTSFLCNPKMPASLSHQMSSPWESQDLFHFGHLVDAKSRKLITFPEFQEKHELPHQAFYGYLQIRRYA